MSSGYFLKLCILKIHDTKQHFQDILINFLEDTFALTCLFVRLWILHSGIKSSYFFVY